MFILFCFIIDMLIFCIFDLVLFCYCIDEEVDWWVYLLRV